eukprot:Seg924.4 transcript_id=Seg924.4/GoldUCD/mRNA.D3Y31 product="hypothetical protein" protein_id=Seg924.4/GoldUCD/D3Y31
MGELEENLNVPATVTALVVSPTPLRPPLIPKMPIVKAFQLDKLAIPSTSSAIPPISTKELDEPTALAQKKTKGKYNCVYCKKPKSKMESLHFMLIRTGQPCFFYCPEMMTDHYGTPQDMCLDNFVKTEFFGPAVEAVFAKREANARVKATAEDRCGEHGWKTPGGSRKT